MAENTENWTKLESDSRYPRKYQFEELEQVVSNLQQLDFVDYKGTVDNYAELAGLTGLEIGDGYVNLEDGLVYVWNGTEFPAEGDGLDVSMKPIGVVEEGNEFAVSGGEVFDYVNNQIDFLGIEQEVLTSITTSTNSLGSNYRFCSYENRLFENKVVSKITVEAYEAGTFSVLKIKNRNTPDMEVLEKQTFDVVVGLNTIETNIYIERGTDLAFLDVTDTALIRYINGSPNPEGGRFYAQNVNTGNWALFPNNLNIEVSATSSVFLTNMIQEDSLSGLSFSILGDSISTFSGYIPSGNSNFYPKPETVPDITNVNQTYWGRLINEDGMILNVNNSSSGSQVVSTSGALSFYNRVTDLGTNSDFIFLFGGTNDWLNSVPIGDTDLSQPKDIATFIGSYRYVLEYILENHLNSKLIVLIPMQRRKSNDEFPSINGAGVAIQEYIKTVINICEWYGVDYVRTDFVQTNFNWETYTGEGTHPTDKGMEVIYSLLKSKLITYLQ